MPKCNNRTEEYSANQFCGVDDKVYTLCGGQRYNTSTRFCLLNTVTDKCGGLMYNATEFCFGTDILSKCGGVSAGATYDRDTEACCGNNKYIVTTEFCSSNAVFGKCGGNEYDPATEFCSRGNVEKIVLRCGGSAYNGKTHFCYDDVIYSKCGGTIEYTPGTEACCGNNKYTLATQECGTGLCAVPYEKTRMHYGREKTQFCDERDGQKYVYVTIGSQTWMAENLNYGGPASNPNSIGMCVGASGASGTLVSSGGHCGTYGRLYNWSAAMNGATSSTTNPSGIQGVCPSGWHLPSDAEWTALTNHVGSPAGTRLKASSGWSSGNGTDVFGFSALPGGGGGSGGFYLVGDFGYWWSATEDDASFAWLRYMSSNYSNVYSVNYDKSPHLFSVRCVKSEP
jgi:uncharacterized protein (TIGR02145 family)